MAAPVMNPRESWDEADSFTPGPLHLTRLMLPPRMSTLGVRDIHLWLAWAWDTDGRLLWAQPRRDMLVVQAPTPAHVERLGGVECSASVVTPAFEEGQRVELSGIFNPQAARKSGAGGRGQRTAVPPEHLSAWFTARLAGVVDVAEVRAEPLSALHTHKPGRVVHAARAGFHAEGIVAHPRRLAWLCAHGLGAQKAYGCGLLLAVAP